MEKLTLDMVLTEEVGFGEVSEEGVGIANIRNASGSPWRLELV